MRVLTAGRGRCRSWARRANKSRRAHRSACSASSASFRWDVSAALTGQQLRLQYLAREEQGATGGDRATLDDLRRQLEGLRDAVAPAAAAAAATTAGGQLRSGAPAPNRDDVRRLMEQRATLLRTGVYAPDDPVVRALDAEIQAAMALAH